MSDASSYRPTVSSYTVNKFWPFELSARPNIYQYFSNNKCASDFDAVSIANDGGHI